MGTYVQRGQPTRQHLWYTPKSSCGHPQIFSIKPLSLTHQPVDLLKKRLPVNLSGSPARQRLHACRSPQGAGLNERSSGHSWCVLLVLCRALKLPCFCGVCVCVCCCCLNVSDVTDVSFLCLFIGLVDCSLFLLPLSSGISSVENLWVLWMPRTSFQRTSPPMSGEKTQGPVRTAPFERVGTSWDRIL